MAQAAAEALAARADLQPAGSFGRGETPPEADVIVDFTTPRASADLADACARAGRPALVLGATGWTEGDHEAVVFAARSIPIVKSGNFSLGVNLLLGLVEQAARALGPEYDAEVMEAHHRRKVDAPSGTALMLAGAVHRGRSPEREPAGAPAPPQALTPELSLDMALRRGPRREGLVGFSVVRAGGIVGEHSVMFAAEDEIVTLSHSARDRSLFARGALVAAAWVVGRPPGLYDMQDVLGLRA
jgi:4-hydroxy-tetrahydrodipicolinate reductase